MRRKWIIPTCITAILLLVWLVRVISLNSTVEQQQEKIYEVGDRVYFGDNYYDVSTEVIDGYSLEVMSAKVYEWDEYKKIMGVPAFETSIWHADYILDVEVHVYNDGYEKDGGIAFVYTYLASSDNRLAANTELIGAIYPKLGTDPQGFSIRTDTDMIFHIPYQIEGVPALYVGDEKKYLETTDFYLNVTHYPIKQMVLLHDGSKAE